MSGIRSRRATILALATALARERGWALAASRQSRHLRVNATTRLTLQTRGLAVVAVATFMLDPDAPMESPEDLARAIGAGLTDTALAIAKPPTN